MDKIYRRFFDKVILPKNESDCWLWTASKDRDGYGYFYFDKKRNGRAHHFSLKYLAFMNRNGGLVCHTCDNSSCVNPKHLYVGTPQTNMQDRALRECYESVRGENSSFAKLTEEQVKDIRNSARSGDKLSALASKYDMTYQGIWLIVSGKNWKHAD